MIIYVRVTEPGGSTVHEKTTQAAYEALEFLMSYMRKEGSIAVSITAEDDTEAVDLLYALNKQSVIDVPATES